MSTLTRCYFDWIKFIYRECEAMDFVHNVCVRARPRCNDTPCLMFSFTSKVGLTGMATMKHWNNESRLITVTVNVVIITATIIAIKPPKKISIQWSTSVFSPHLASVFAFRFPFSLSRSRCVLFILHLLSLASSNHFQFFQLFRILPLFSILLFALFFLYGSSYCWGEARRPYATSFVFKF